MARKWWLVRLLTVKLTISWTLELLAYFDGVMTSHNGDLRHIKIWTTYNACNLVISHLICFFTVTNTFHFYGSFSVVQTGAITKWHNMKDWKDSEKYQQHKSEPTMLFATPRNTQFYLQWFLLSLHPASLTYKNP